MVTAAPSTAVSDFETALGISVGVGAVFTFRYGRTALYAFLKAMQIENATVVVQAYTCSVVAHAIVLSGNRPRFIDIALDDYNQQLEALDASIDSTTRAVVVTHLFGQPADVTAITDIVRRHEARLGHRIYIVQDLAHAIAPSWNGHSVAAMPDVAIWGFGISKLVTSVFGGAVGTNDSSIAAALSQEQERLVVRAGWRVALRSRIYALAARAALSGATYGVVQYLDEHTSLLSSFTKAYHLDGNIEFPPGALVAMAPFEAAIGLAQVRGLKDAIAQRQRAAAIYNAELSDLHGVVLPKITGSATYSHYAVRVRDRARVVAKGRRRGVHFGQVIDYVVPEFPAYRAYSRSGAYPNAETCRATMINLPIFNRMPDEVIERVVEALRYSVGN
jgi:perosamine synthetase